MKARRQKCEDDSVDLTDPEGEPAPASPWFPHLYPDGSSSSGEKTNHTLLLITGTSKKTKPTCSLPILGLLTLLTKISWHKCLTCPWMLFMFPFNTSNGYQSHLSWVLHTCGDLTVSPDNMNKIPKLRPMDGHGSPLFTLFQLSSLFLTPQILKV